MPQLLALSRWARNERENNVTSVTHSALEHFYTNAARELGTRTLLAHNIWAEAKDVIDEIEYRVDLPEIRCHDWLQNFICRTSKQWH